MLHPDRPWPGELAIVVVPGVQMVDDAFVRKIDEYASAGGQLILTCRTATMDKTGQLFEGPIAAPILPLIGGAVEAYDGLPEDVWANVELDGRKFRWGAWAELLYAQEESKIVARYADLFYKDAAAIIQHKRGGGMVTYCGVCGEAALTDALIDRIATTNRIQSLGLPPRTQLSRRDDHWVFVNFQDAAVDAPAPVDADFVIGARRVEPAGVAVWRGVRKVTLKTVLLLARALMFVVGPFGSGGPGSMFSSSPCIAAFTHFLNCPSSR